MNLVNWLCHILQLDFLKYSFQNAEMKNNKPNEKLLNS